MISFDNWLAETDSIPESGRAVQAWNRINDKPVSVAFKKSNGTLLAAQLVRLESDSSLAVGSEVNSPAGQAPRRNLTVFGVVNHPDSAVADTDMAEGYRFVYNSDEYRIVDVIVTLGELQGVCEVVG